MMTWTFVRSLSCLTGLALGVGGCGAQIVDESAGEGSDALIAGFSDALLANPRGYFDRPKLSGAFIAQPMGEQAVSLLNRLEFPVRIGGCELHEVNAVNELEALILSLKVYPAPLAAEDGWTELVGRDSVAAAVLRVSRESGEFGVDLYFGQDAAGGWTLFQGLPR